MITIITDTRLEYLLMMKSARNFVCTNVNWEECKKYSDEVGCDACYKANHIKCGIRVIEPVDSPAPNDL